MLNVLRHRPTALFDLIAPASFEILWALVEAVHRVHLSLEITCGTDSHALPDPHPLGEAYDVSVPGLSAQQITEVYERVRMSLGPLFTVLYEVREVPSDPTLRSIASVNRQATGPHVHIQRKRGTTYPPAPVTPGTPMVA